jgi:hypothetical protein
VTEAREVTTMPDPFDWSTLRIAQDGDVVIAPCLALTVWFRVTDAPALLDFHDRAMEALGPLLTHYKAEEMKRPAKITARARTMIPTWLKKPAGYKSYFARFQGAEDVSGASFEVHFRYIPRLTPEQQERWQKNLPTLAEQGFFTAPFPTSTFRVTVPLDHPLAVPEQFRDWALGFEAVKSGEFVTGGCDLSLNYDYGRGDVVIDRVKASCARHPGLDWLHPDIHNYLHRYESKPPALLPLVKRAGWITLVNERSVEALGGTSKLAEALRSDPAVKIRELAHGLALQAGEGPRPGDLSRLDVPYRSVAAAIRPVRIGRVGDPRSPDDWMTEWLGALDRPLAGAQS